MHVLRKNKSSKCLVCGAEPFRECDTQVNAGHNPFDEPEAQLAWAEFALMAAVHNLREIKPDHYLVKVIEAAIDRAS